MKVTQSFSCTEVLLRIAKVPSLMVSRLLPLMVKSYMFDSGH